MRNEKGQFVKGTKENLGSKRTPESRLKMRNAQLKNPNRYWLGKHITEEHKKKSSKGWFKKGNLPHNFQNWKSREPYSVDWSKTLKRSIRERDKYICQLCVEPQGERALSVHHIDYGKKNCNPENLISLCHRCHMKTNNKRDYWTKYFKTK